MLLRYVALPPDNWADGRVVGNMGKLFHHQLPDHQHINVNEIHDEQLTIGQRIADQVATVMGSWNFLIGQALLLTIWFIINSVAWFYHFDAYPYILCNLLMSAQAAFATPLIMMSQNRQATKDRLTAENTYKVDVKSEQEVRAILAHMEAQDEELLKQTNYLIELIGHKKKEAING